MAFMVVVWFVGDITRGIDPTFLSYLRVQMGRRGNMETPGEDRFIISVQRLWVPYLELLYASQSGSQQATTNQ
jgi:hypothetical protein